MTCGHCVGSITKAVHAIDPSARVNAELSAHRVQIEPAKLDRSQLGDAIREAGFTPVSVADVETAKERPAPRRAAAAAAAERSDAGPLEAHQASGGSMGST
jgi:copper chaperone